MKLNYTFESILNTLSAKFPNLGDEISLYLLAFIVRQYNIGLGFFDLFNYQVLEQIENFVSSKNALQKMYYNRDSKMTKSSIDQRFCKFLIQDYLDNNIRLKRDSYYELQSLRKFLIELAEPKPNQIIYSPNCGIGSIFIDLYETFPDYNFKFNGHADYKTGFLCEANLFANNVKVPFNIISFNPLKFESDIEIEIEEEADIAITIPPLISNLSVDNYVEIMLAVLNEKGKAIIVVPEGFLVNAMDKKIREKYLSSDLIEKVVSLPENAFMPNSAIKSSVIIFNKNKARKGLVFFDGKEEKFEPIEIQSSFISSQKNLNLRVSRYALKESKELRNILAHQQHDVRKIKDLVELFKSGRFYSPKNRITENSSENLPYVRVSDLAKNETEFDLDISKIERKISRNNAHKVIDFSAILVSKIAPKLKPTYFEFTNNPIIIGSDIIALKMKEDVDIEYFLTQLHSRIVQIQVEMMSSGTTINRISTEDFLNIQIILPPLEKQRRRQILEMRGVIEEKAIAQEKVAKAEKQIDAIEYEVIANMNHSLKNKLGVIINDYDTLVRFLHRKERANSPISFNDTIRPIFENESISDVDTIQLITERLKNNLLDTSKVFNTSLKLQTRELKKDSVELVVYFRNELKPSFAGKDFTIEIVAEPKLKLNVFLDKEVFRDVIDNLVNNAELHGFTEENREYKIVFELSKSEEIYDEKSESVKNYARIVYKNNGKPFPKGFSFDDYVRYSSKAGKTQGTGIGGAVVDKIIKLHEGKFNELPTNEHSIFSVQFEILLPLED